MPRQQPATNGPSSILLWLTMSIVLGCSASPATNIESLSFSKKADQVSGDSAISDRAEAASQSATISNPRATEIRFDGEELLLGSGNCRALGGDELLAALRRLLDDEKKRSAAAMIRLHTRSAHRLLIDQTNKSDDAVADFVAAVLDQGKPSGIWTSHLASCKDHRNAAKGFAISRSELLSLASAGGPLADIVAQMKQAAEELDSLPLKLESQRLAALASVASGESEQAVNTLASAAELAAQSGLPHASSDLWMLACQASMQLENVSQARKCWQAAVATQMAAVRSRPASQLLPTVDTVFWEQADKLKHPGDQYPAELNLAFAPWYSRIGFTLGSETGTQVALWSAIAEFQLATGQPHLATLSIKRAEVDAAESTKPWLRIALARAMAAQGQESVAVTILGSLDNDAVPAVRAAALAALGSIKVQAGAYEQGSRFLVDALNTQEAGEWPGKLAAKADLANVRLIVGRLDEALPTLHSVQNEMMTAGHWQSLCQSLENEAAILEHEGLRRDAGALRERIRAIENQ